MGNISAKTLPGIFFEQANSLKDRPLFWSKKEGFWEGVTWSDAAVQVRKLASVLQSYGVKKGDRVLIASENRPEWAISDLAVMSLGAIVVPAYTSNTEEDNNYLLTHSEAKLAITSLAFILVDVPEPVWKISTTNSESWSPFITSFAAFIIALAIEGDNNFKSLLVLAAENFITPSASMNGLLNFKSLIGKFSTALAV